VAGVKFLLAVLFGMPLAAAVILRAFGGDPFATSIAAGFVALFVLQHIAARTATRPAPRKADPAKIARLERELGVGPEPEPPKPPDGSVTWRDGKPGIVQGDDWYPVVANVVDTEAPTTVATFHGAPTFGHKIEGP
jgi:hypothetical protein